MHNLRIPTMQPALQVFPIAFPDEIRPGDNLVRKILFALEPNKLCFRQGDILVLKHKIVSKAEGQLVSLDGVQPSPASRAWARRHNLDARVVELALEQSRRIVRLKHGAVITETA